MTELEQAARQHRMWFGSYTRSGVLRKTQVWCFLREGTLEFLTGEDSFKAKRIRRNPQVICYLGSENGPALEGTAAVVTDAAEVRRGYRAYWKTHPWAMLLLGLPIWSRVRSGKQVLVRVNPAEPNVFAGITEPAA